MQSTNILFIGATHGNEPIGVKALCSLNAKVKNINWIIGNPPAYGNNSRTFEGDLNRSAPGDITATNYASRRAAEILKISDTYDWTVDIHGTTAYSGIFIIITKLTRANLRLAVRLNVPRIVYWPSISPDLNGPLSEYFKCGLEIECGPKHLPLIEEKLITILEEFVNEKDVDINEETFRLKLLTRELYEVVGISTSKTNNLEEFQETLIDGKKRFPLLINQYAEQGIVCYTMKKKSVDDWLQI
ncbi:MAG: succinylglutamate desuccinylase/aspartoacylase family protein [Patescibacteria group bacterium]